MDLEQIKKQIYLLYNEALQKDIYFNTFNYSWLLGSQVINTFKNSNLIYAPVLSIVPTFKTLFNIQVIEDTENETTIKLLKDITKEL